LSRFHFLQVGAGAALGVVLVPICIPFAITKHMSLEDDDCAQL